MLQTQKYVNLERELIAIQKQVREKRITTVSFEDYENSYKKTMEDGSGFIIDDSIDYSQYIESKDLKKIREVVFENSIFSYKYGISLEDEERVIDSLYQCNCGHTKGIENIDLVCTKCNTPVQRLEPKRVGWLILNNYKVIHPFILYMMSVEKSPIKAQKKTRVKKVEGLADKELKKEEPEKNEEEEEKEFDPLEEEKVEEEKIEETPVKKKKEVKETSNRKNLSLIEALNQKKLEYSWEDILEPNGENLEKFIIKYMKNRKELLLKYRALWYTNKILVISKNYRYINMQEVEVTGSNVVGMHPLNLYYMNISAVVGNLNNRPLENSKSWARDQLVVLCRELARVGKSIFDDIGSSKKSHIRGEVYGKKYTFSGRLIIEPIIDKSITQIDVCQIPVEYFRSTFVQDIIKIGKQLKIPIKRLHNLVDIDYQISEEDRILLKEEIFPRVKNPVVYTNREPDIYISSITAFKVHSLIDEMVLRVPTHILPAMAGDSTTSGSLKMGLNDGKVFQIIYHLEVFVHQAKIVIYLVALCNGKGKVTDTNLNDQSAAKLLFKKSS